jgi:nucleoid DNA-binding protein
VDDFFDILRGYLIEDKPYVRIEIRNFGVFESKPTKAKPKARNPRTNEEIFVPAHKKTRFKAGKILKEHLKKPI